MKLLKRMFVLFQKIVCWYREPIPGYRIFRVDPVTVLLAISLAATLLSTGEAGYDLATSKEIADQWRNGSEQLEAAIEKAYDQNELSGYEREVALQRLEEMAPVFDDVAEMIENSRRENWYSTICQGGIDTGVSVACFPARVPNTIKRLGDLYTIYSLGNFSIKNPFSLTEEEQALIKIFDLLKKNHQNNNEAPFSDKQAQINQQIMDVMGTDVDALFLARMRTRVNLLRRDYIGLLKQNPCKKSDVLTTLRADLIRLGWGKGSGVFGEGEKFPTYEAFLDWLIAQAIDIEKDDITLKMVGKTDMTVTCQIACAAVPPPTLSGPISISINLETCEVKGILEGEGNGTAARTPCGEGSGEENVDCTAYGEMTFSGDLNGFAKPSGEITVNTASVWLEFSSFWVGGPCTGGSKNSGTLGVELDGMVNWNESASGSIKILYPSDGLIVGEWSAETGR